MMETRHEIPDDDEWLPSAIYLIDTSSKLVEAWSNAFSAVPEVTPIAGDYFQQPPG